jgi:glycosyltransferase involved in cell wall biosynthesis
MAGAAPSGTGNKRPLIALGANDAWNLVNYRAALIRVLQSNGFEVAALAPSGPHATTLQEMGVSFHEVPIKARGTSPLGDVRVLLAFARHFRIIRPAAFLGFTSKPNIYGSLAARLCGVPVINNISGLGTAFSREGLLQRLVAQLYRFALQRSATVFFQNRDDRELFETKGLVRSDQAALLPGSGVDLARFTPVDRAAEQRPFTFLFAARLLWDKGVREFVEAARLVGSERGDVRFRILGFIEPRGAAAVPESELRAWEESGIIEYLGPRDDVRQTFSGADCVVLPSYYREGVPRVLLEASAMALPVITTDAPGCRDAVEDEVTGLLCAPGSVDSLVEAMERLLRLNPGERRAMGLAARTRMEMQFSDERVHRAYLDALAKLGTIAT